MSLLFRLGLIAMAIVAAFAGGYFLKSYVPATTVAAEPQSVAEAPRKPVRSITTSSGAHVATSPTGRPTVEPVIHLPPPPATSKPEPILQVPAIDVRPAPPPADPKLPDVPDPSEPGFQLIKRELGLKTTVLDKSEPLPEVLRDAKPNDLRIGPPAVPTPPGAVKAPPAVKLVNNRSIELDFEVTKVGRSNIRSTELWATRDGGVTWRKVDQKFGCESPFCTRLASEGTYGFKLVFESESGKRTREPLSGQPPDSSLELDTSPPVITLFLPEELPDPAGRVRLNWSMTDPHLDPARVRLDYSSDGKVWNSIEKVDACKNQNGSYSHFWTMPREVPPRVLLRVTVRDKAGNVGSAQTNDKVAVDLVQPEGKITRLRIAGAESEPGPMPRLVDARQVFLLWAGFAGRHGQ